MSGGAHVDPSNKKIALQIAILAVVLAFSEMLGKGAQTEALSANIKASNLWAFYQAKTLRQTTIRTAADTLAAQSGGAPSESAAKQIDKWRKTAERYQSEPETNEGRDQLAQRAKQAEKERDLALASYHQYEIASAAVQIAIVLASAEVITSVVALGWISAGLGVAAVAFCLIGFFWPTAVHLF